MTWQHCAEIALMVLFAILVITAAAMASMAVVRAYRKTSDLRTIDLARKAEPTTPVSEEHKVQLAKFWEDRRKQWDGYADDLNRIANPIRKDGIDIVKAASDWGRLGVQFALAANGGALTALPYLLGLTTGGRLTLSVHDAQQSAFWFVGGFIAAGACCVVAYADFQVTAAMYWANLRIEIRAAQQRHFELNDTIPIESHLGMLSILQATSARTSLAGVTLALLGWLALIFGTLRLLASML